MCTLGELPCDVLHKITELLVEYHPKDSTNIRRVNRQFKYHADICIKSYETELCSMLSACRISVISPKARLKYTFQYMQSVNNKVEENINNKVEENINNKVEENMDKPALTISKRDMVFLGIIFLFYSLYNYSKKK